MRARFATPADAETPDGAGGHGETQPHNPEDSMTTLPSIQECHEFFEALNAERVDLGLAPIEELDYDSAEPRSTDNCLSARNCYAPGGYWVGNQNAWVLADETDEHRRIPAAILRVTDYFDECDDPSSDGLSTLRARLVEAGIVRPA